jgi:metal-dependent amidase/aminoacylase/carboxypeptidase family protein
MWGEDFAYYGAYIPAAFWMLGVRPDNIETMPGLHNPRFTPDESALSTGAALLANTAIDWLANDSPFSQA